MVSSFTDVLQPFTIAAPGLNATFIGHGATLMHLFMNDGHGTARVVAVGHDTPEEYAQNTQTTQSYYGAVVGEVRRRSSEHYT